MGEHTTHQMRQTSLDSYHGMQAELSERETEVLNAIRELTQTHGGATDYETTRHLGREDNTNYVRPTRYSLMKQNLVIPAGKRPCRITEKRAIVWRPK